MIQKLRRKFIWICIISFVSVFIVLFGLIYLITSLQTEKTLDRHADVISQNGGIFPSFGANPQGNSKPSPPEGFNNESPFTTRYFTVKLNKLNDIIHSDITQVSGVSESMAKSYAESAMASTNSRGWVGDYRYKIYTTSTGKSIVFVSGVSLRESNRIFLLSSLSVFSACSLLIIILIILISKKAVKPAVESYEKQKQFITNANHELKTPITLIRTNLDILESEIGENRWLTDIKDEALLMNELIRRMVELAKMDEEGTKLETTEFNLSDAVEDTVSMFNCAIIKSGKSLSCEIEKDIIYNGNEAGIRQIISILMDNALKYCDDDGEITVNLSGRKHPVLEVKNDYAAVKTLEYDRLFDRFYRADKARTYGTGFGIGLSFAKAIAEKSGGNIFVHAENNKKINFSVKL